MCNLTVIMAGTTLHSVEVPTCTLCIHMTYSSSTAITAVRYCLYGQASTLLRCQLVPTCRRCVLVCMQPYNPATIVGSRLDESLPVDGLSGHYNGKPFKNKKTKHRVTSLERSTSGQQHLQFHLSNLHNLSLSVTQNLTCPGRNTECVRPNSEACGIVSARKMP